MSKHGLNADRAGFPVLISVSVAISCLIGWITRTEFMIIGIILWVCFWLRNDTIDLLQMHEVHGHDFFAMNRRDPVAMIALAAEEPK